MTNGEESPCSSWRAHCDALYGEVLRSDHDLVRVTPVAFDDHRSCVAIVATVNSFSAIVAACYQHAGSDHTEHNDLSD
jgi:hypothetical protein